MRLRYELTRLDLFRGGVQVLAYHRQFLTVLVGMLAVVWFSTFRSDAYQEHSTGYRVAAACVATALVGGSGIVGLTLMLGMRSLSRRDHGVLGGHTLEITPEGLLESTEAGESLTRWSAGLRLRRTRRYAFIFVDVDRAHIVPLYRPVHEGSAVEFLDQVEGQIQSARRN